MPYVDLDGMRMYYAEHGRAEGPPLVLLHSFMATGDQWRRHLDAFGVRYRLIVPDLRGHGRSDNPAGLPAMNHRQFARDVVGLCRALGVDRAAFVGVSTGAMLLLSLALDAPDLPRAFVLAGGTFRYDDDLRRWWRTATPESVTRSIERARAMHTALGPDHWRLVAEAWIALGEHAHEEDFPAPDEIGAIRVPTLIVHGDRDHFFPVAIPVALYGLLPDAELCILPNTGHFPQADRPEWFAEIVLDFLARRDEGARLNAPDGRP